LTRSSDWQLCQFLLLSCAAGGYLDDFLLAMQAYEKVLSQGESAYPQTSKGRESALYWLNQSNIVELLEQHKEHITQAWLASCKETWDKMQSNWKALFGSEHLSWHALGKWLEQVRATPAVMATKIEPAVILSAPANNLIEDDRQASDALERVWEYYWKKGSKLKAMCLSRSDAWARVAIPQEQHGKTWVEPLRAVDHQKMKTLKAQQSWEALWECAEQCFMQPGGPFDMNLQYYIIESLEHLNKPDILIWAKSFLMAWIEAYPAILDMHFNDGTPFCDESLRGWVLGLKAPVAVQVEKCASNEFEIAEAGIRKRRKEAVEWMKAFVPLSYPDQIWHRYLCILNDHVNQKGEQAWRGYQVLMAMCEEKELFQWDKHLMKRIWILGVDISERKGVRYEQIMNQIIENDFIFAATLTSDVFVGANNIRPSLS
jgi:disulfide oxidoreductase YuzD